MLIVVVYRRLVKMPSCLSGYFAVMLRQAALAVPVAYQKSTLPSPRPCLPCLTSKYPRLAVWGYFAVMLCQAALAVPVASGIAGAFLL